MGGYDFQQPKSSVTKQTTSGGVHSIAQPLNPDYPRFRLLALAAGLVGIQFCWAVQVGYVTKSLLELGLAQRFVSYAWLAGPIAGIVVQPIVGVLSDRCTSRLGRRRPFLIAGTIFSVFCLCSFSYARQIGQAMGDDLATGNPRALLIAITSFWALDFSINSAQGPLRALLSDVVPPSQHKLGNSYFALATGIGNGAGSFLGSVSLSNYFTFFQEDVQALYVFAAIALVVTMSCTVIFVKEVPLGYDSIPSDDRIRPISYETVSPGQVDDENHSSSSTSNSISFFKAATVAPHPFFPVFIIQCFAWFGWFTMFVFATSWVGAEVFNGRYSSEPGTPLRKLYDEGVRMGNLGIALQSVLTIFSALTLPSLLRRASSQSIYFISQILLALALSSSLLFHHRWQAWIATSVLASTGFSWAVTMTIPWSLMSEAITKAAPEHAGIYFTMFNLSQCIPEIMVSLVAEEVERLTKSQAAVMTLGGIAVFISAVLIIVLRVGKDDVRTTHDERDVIQEDSV